jgi:protein TonB
MKNRNSKFFPITLCAAALLHAGALVLVPDISRRTEEKPAKTPVQVTLSFPQETPAPPLPLEPKQARAEEPPPLSSPKPLAGSPAEPATEKAEEPRDLAAPDMGGETEQAQDFTAEPAALTERAAGETPGPFNPNPNVRAALLLQYEAMIRRQIDRQKEYPYQARRQDQEGTVEIYFVLSRQGQLMEEPVLGKKTRYRLLNNAAIEAVKKAVPYPPFPQEFPEEKMAFSITLAFSLTGNTF